MSGIVTGTSSSIKHTGQPSPTPISAPLCEWLQSDFPGGRAAIVGNSRGMFTNAVGRTALWLTYRSEYVARERRVIRTWP